MRRLTVVAAFAMSGWVAGQCLPSGLTLQTTGGRLGGPFSLTLAGTPGVSGLLGFDLGAGPVLTPIGNVCLSLTPAMQVQPVSLDFAGGFSMSGVVPPNPALSGLTIFIQAAMGDATQPNGYALSNGVSAKLRPPILYLVDRVGGNFMPPAPPPPGEVFTYDTLTDTPGTLTVLPAPIGQALGVPALGLLVVWVGANIIAFDGTTGATVLNLPMPAPVGPFWSASPLSVAGSTLLLTDTGTSTASGTLRAYSLPTGALLWTLTLLGVSAPVVPPGSGLGYIRTGSSLRPVVLATGATYPPISLGPVSSQIWHTTVMNGIIHCGMGTSTSNLVQSINAFDTNSQTALFATPVPSALPSASVMEAGQGSMGPAVFLRNQTTLMQLSPVTLTATAPAITLPAGFKTMVASGGGTEWLMTTSLPQGPCGPFSQCMTIHVMNASTLVINPVASIPLATISIEPLIQTVPSSTLNKAYIAMNYDSTVYGLNTDPTTAVTSAWALPWSPPVLLTLAID
jgi:hypothetical protein